MQVMKAKHLLLLAAALTAIAAGRAAAQGVFDSVPANASCAARTVSAAARGEIECAMRSSESDTSRSFSFINGVCVLSDSPDCAMSGVGSVFRKRSSTTPSFLVPEYVQQTGGRQFWVFQQRLTSQVLFNRTWSDYEQGFGNSLSDFWAGLRQISDFTKSRNSTLRIEMTVADGTNRMYIGEWQNFTVADARTNYTMSYNSYLSGSSNFTADTLADHRDRQFSTLDVDNDARNAGSCSTITCGGGGFWFGGCADINPNGEFTTAIGVTVCASCISSRYAQTFQPSLAIRMMLQI